LNWGCNFSGGPQWEIGWLKVQEVILSNHIFYGPTFFAKLIFFPPKLFLVFWKWEIFLSKKNFGGKKINLAKTCYL
jgi:hypothetical protein